MLFFIINSFFQYFSSIFERIWNFFGLNEERVESIIYTGIIIILLSIIKRYINRFVNNKVTKPKSRYVWHSTVKYTYIFLTVFTILVIWFEGIDNVSDFIGFISAGLVIALKDPILNFIGWVFIITTRPFEVGQRIEFDGVKGDIIDIGANQFIINEIGVWVDGEQSTGRVVHIPNMFVFSVKHTNYSKGIPYIWNELNIIITFESDWIKAKKILSEVIFKHAEKVTLDKVNKHEHDNYMVYYNKLDPIVYVALKSFGVQLSMRYLVDPKKRRSSEAVIWEACLHEIKKNDDITWAYPTTRIYRNNEENEPKFYPRSEYYDK